MNELGTYLSRYQGKITAEAVGRMIGAGVRHIGIRLTSGAGYIDPTWEHNAAMLRDTSILLFPWHFTTTDDAAKQYKNFITQANKFDRWRLPPAQDCEAYMALGLESRFEVYSVSQLQADPRLLSSLVMGMSVSNSMGIAREGKLSTAISPDGDTLGVYTSYALSYPTEATVDVIGRQLTQWMTTQPALVDYVYPAIYTNASSGNKIFKTASMSRYPLWVANWHSAGKPPLEKPNKPAVWKDTPYWIWQDAIIDGQPYGIDGQVSHELWGPLMPFPGDEPPPPPPPADEIEMTLKLPDNSVWTGTLKETLA